MSELRLRQLRRIVLAAGLLVLAVMPSTGAAQEQPDCGDVDVSPCDLAVTARGRALSANRVVITVFVRNIGESRSYQVPLTISAEGWSPFVETVPGMEGGGRERVIAQLEVPSSAQGTRAVLHVEVAPHKNEGRRGSNAVDVSINIPESQAPPPPDLVAGAAVARVIGDGDRVQVSGVVRNDGGPTRKTITLAVSAPGWDGNEESLEGSIEQGGQRDFTFVFDTPDEQRGTSVRFHVAVEPLESEEVTANNDADTNAVDIPASEDPSEGPSPDVAVARAAARIIENGQRVEVSGSVANRGDSTDNELTLTVGSAGWDSQAASLPDGLASGATRAYSLALDIPDHSRGVDAVFHVELAPVEGEVELANNARDTVAVAIPLVGTDEGGGDVPWALVVAGAAAALAAAVLAARWFARRRRAPPATAPPSERSAPAPRPSPPPSAAEESTSVGPPAGASTEAHPSVEETPTAEQPAAVRPERLVSTGFASEWEAETPLSADTPLLPSTPYLFWLEVGPPVAGSIERAPTDLPADLPAEAVLTVAVFALDDALSVEPKYDRGQLRLQRDGSVVVARHAARDVRVAEEPGLDERRLFFRVRTGVAPGIARLRCNIYYRNVLVQARLITAMVRASPGRVAGALASDVDYTLAPALDPARLAGLEPHRLSVLVNESRDGSHDFYFLGDNDFKSSASFDGHELQNLIVRARASLKRAAWGDPDDWTEGKRYRYDDFDLERLHVDLVRFALAGYRFYDAIINRLAGGRDRVRPLAELMLEPGLVQIASRESPRHVVPAALIYDYPLDSTGELGDYELCSAFASALVERRSLADSPCFRGECPNRDAKTVVCPSGFWGYRHALGMPVSVATTAPDLPTEIVSTRGPHLIVAVSTDPAFVMRIQHETALRGLRTELGWLYADTRERALALLKEGGAEIVYFYCHGGMLEDVPFIQVGPPTERGITRDLLRSEAIEWSAPRPLVFINGCHTTALEPEKAIEFVSALVETSGASGVIGTEITVFEPLASAFAEECLRRFLAGEPIGAAIRGARLGLLARGNPLGLAYIPFATASLKLRAA